MKRARAHTRDQDRIVQQPVIAARRPPPSSTTVGTVALPVIHGRMIRPQQWVGLLVWWQFLRGFPGWCG